MTRVTIDVDEQNRPPWWILLLVLFFLLYSAHADPDFSLKRKEPTSLPRVYSNEVAQADEQGFVGPPERPYSRTSGAPVDPLDVYHDSVVRLKGMSVDGCYPTPTGYILCLWAPRYNTVIRMEYDHPIPIGKQVDVEGLYRCRDAHGAPVYPRLENASIDNF